MHVTNTTGDDVFLPAIDDYVPAGATVDVDAEVGASLVNDQGWTSAAQKAARRRARRDRAERAAHESDDADASDPDPQEA
jgi:hypothetical protein